MTPWKRKGFFYYAMLQAQKRGRLITITRKLDFISYHLIRLIHGDDKLIDMALKNTDWE